MRSLIAILVFVFSFSLFAATNETRYQATDTGVRSRYSMEPSISISSINRGTTFMSVGIVADVGRRFSVGIEGDLPVEFVKQEQVYLVKLLGRLQILKNSTTNVFGQVTTAAGFYNTIFSQLDTFWVFGVDAGFMQAITSEWSAGARAGVQLVSAQFNEGLSFNASHFANRFSLVASYNF